MLLKVGSKGDDVKKLQEKLGLKADGNFGPNTEKAVKEWQSKNGLKADGVVGQQTWKKLFEVKNTEVVSENTQTTSSVFDYSKLKGVIPDVVYNQIPDIVSKFNCNNSLRLAHFLAQCGHESGNFKAVSENLNYSEAGLLKTFKKYFTPELAKQYAKKPEKIASRVYGSRMGNGDETSGEGWKFRGRGYIQLTGKSNYQKFTKFIGEDCVSNPDLVATKYPLASAAFFFNSNKLWAICDKGSSDAVVTQVTERVNGGRNGLDDRLKKFKQFYSLLK